MREKEGKRRKKDEKEKKEGREKKEERKGAEDKEKYLFLNLIGWNLDVCNFCLFFFIPDQLFD